MNNSTSSLDNDDIVSMVLDLYKRSLDHTGDGGSEGPSFAGSFASLRASLGSAMDTARLAAVLHCTRSTGHKLGLCPNDEGEATPGLVELSLSFADLNRVLELFPSLEESQVSGDLLWFHAVGGESAVAALGRVVGLHPVAQRLFSDPSPQSVVNHLDSESFICTGVTIYLGSTRNQAALRAQKLTVFARRGLVVSMERELLGVRLGAREAAGPLGPRVILDLVSKYLAEVSKAAAELGAGFLVYLLLSELTRMMGTVLGLYSTCLAHLQQTVDQRRVTHSRRLKVLRDLHNLQSGLVVLKSFFANSTALRLKRGSGAGGSGFRGGAGVLRESHMPYLRDLDESVKWVKRTIESHESAINEVALVHLH